MVIATMCGEPAYMRRCGAGRDDGMVELAFLVLSETVESRTGSGGQAQPVIVNPLTMIQPKYIPGQFSFAITGGVRYDHVNDISEGVSLSISDPNGAVISSGPPMPPPEDPSGEKSIGLVFSIIATNIDMASAGRYTVTARVGDSELGHLDILVKERGEA